MDVGFNSFLYGCKVSFISVWLEIIHSFLYDWQVFIHFCMVYKYFFASVWLASVLHQYCDNGFFNNAGGLE